MAKSKTRRTAAQRRATEKLVALNRKRAAAKRRKAKTRKVAAKRKTKAARKKPAARTGRITTSRAKGAPRKNPVKAKRISHGGRSRMPKKNPAPVADYLSNVTNDVLIPSLGGATGAVIADIAYAYAPIRPEWKTAGTKFLTKGLFIVGLGMGLNMIPIVSREMAERVTLGGMTVLMRDAMQDALSQMAPDLRMDGYLSEVRALHGYLSAYGLDGLGYYEASGGYTSPAPIVGDMAEMPFNRNMVTAQNPGGGSHVGYSENEAQYYN